MQASANHLLEMVLAGLEEYHPSVTTSGDAIYCRINCPSCEMMGEVNIDGKMSLCKRTAAVVVVAFRSNVHDNQPNARGGRREITTWRRVRTAVEGE